MFRYCVRYSTDKLPGIGAPSEVRKENTFAGCCAFILYCLRNNYEVRAVWREVRKTR